MKTYTVFCQNALEVGGTTWIAAIEADSVDEAKEEALDQCAESWCMSNSDICVLGVAEGDVNILEWND